MINGEEIQPVNNAESVMPRKKSLKLLYLKQLRLVCWRSSIPINFITIIVVYLLIYGVANKKNDDDDDDDDGRLKNIATRRRSSSG